MISFPACPDARYKLTVNSVPATTSISTGSDTTNAAFGTKKPGAPPKVKVFSVVVSIAGLPAPLSALLPLKGFARVTAVIGRSVGPKEFDKRRRIREDVAVTWIVCRRVVLEKTRPLVLKGGFGRFAGSVNCGIEAQAAIQCPSVVLT